MDKMEERQILDLVFGGHDGLEVVEQEKPDFRCQVLGGIVFGVEVTEFFLSQSAARLRRIPGYCGELLKERRYRHKDDKIRTPVEKVIYRSDETGEECEIEGILGEEYTIDTVLQRLKNLIVVKNEKHGEYTTNVAPVDLIISDVDCVSRCDGLDVLIRAIARNDAAQAICKSGFREIYLVTEQKAKNVCVPLRANLFMAEVYTYQSIFKMYHGDYLGNVRFAGYMESLAHYLTDRFEGIEYEVDKDKRLRFVFSSVAFRYVENGGLDILDISFDAGNQRKCLATELDQEADPELRAHVESERTKVFCCVPICFDTH